MLLTISSRVADDGSLLLYLAHQVHVSIPAHWGTQRSPMPFQMEKSNPIQCAQHNVWPYYPVREGAAGILGFRQALKALCRNSLLDAEHRTIQEQLVSEGVASQIKKSL